MTERASQAARCIGLLVLILGLSPHALADNNISTGALLPRPGLRGSAGEGTRLSVKVKSLNELRWENVIRQRIDIGCGAASLATIMTYYFDFPTTELEMFELSKSHRRWSRRTSRWHW